MGKKKKEIVKSTNVKSPIAKYTIKEKLDQLIVLKTKLNELGLDVYKDEMKDLGKIMNEYLKNDVEYYGKIPLPGSKRVMCIEFNNNKKSKISITLKYDKYV